MQSMWKYVLQKKTKITYNNYLVLVLKCLKLVSALCLCFGRDEVDLVP